MSLEKASGICMALDKNAIAKTMPSNVSSANAIKALLMPCILRCYFALLFNSSYNYLKVNTL
jgi:hypothetical protein